MDPWLLDAIAVAILCVVGFWGWRRGTLVMALSLGGMVAGYVGAFLLFRPLGSLLVRTMSIPAILAYPFASLGLWFVIGSTAGLLQARAMRKRRAQRKNGWTPTPLDGAGGAVLGVMWAIGLLGVVLWVMMGAFSFTGRGSDVAETRSAQTTSVLAERVVFRLAQKITGEEILASAMSVVAGNPSEGVHTIRTVLQDQRFTRLLSNSTTRGQIAAGDIPLVSTYPAIQELAADSTFWSAATRLALVSGSGPPAEALATGIAPLAQSLETLLADDEVRDLIEHSDIIARIKNGDMTALAIDPDFNRLAGRVLSLLRGAP